MLSRFLQLSLQVKHRPQGILPLVAVWLLLKKCLQHTLGRLELLLSYFRRCKSVLIRGIIRPKRGCPGESGLGIFQEIHFQAYSAVTLKNLRILRFDLLRPYPVGEGALELSL